MLMNVSRLKKFVVVHPGGPRFLAGPWRGPTRSTEPAAV
jgi:hypothetical protein